MLSAIPLQIPVLTRRYRGGAIGSLRPLGNIQPASHSGPRKFKSFLAWSGVTAGAASIVAVVLISTIVGRDKPASATSPPVQLTRDSGFTTGPAISRDGKFLTYASDRGNTANLDICVQRLLDGTPTG